MKLFITIVLLFNIAFAQTKMSKPMFTTIYATITDTVNYSYDSVYLEADSSITRWYDVGTYNTVPKASKVLFGLFMTLPMWYPIRSLQYTSVQLKDKFITY